MGLAGELWPYFRPNYEKVKDYVQQLYNDGADSNDPKRKLYNRVVAFLPTGWALSSKWNREHAISRETITIEHSSTTADQSKKPSSYLEIEIHLVPYSEHSTYSELTEFVQYLKPRQVIPTVFSDEAEYRKLEKRFQSLLDAKRAKQAFLQSMKKSKSDLISSSISSFNVKEKERVEGKEKRKEVVDLLDDDDSSDDSNAPASKKVKAAAEPQSISPALESLVAMGFPRARAQVALRKRKGNLERAVELLLSTSASTSVSSSMIEPQQKSKLSPSPGKSSPVISKSSSSTSNSPQITRFFKTR